MIRFVCIASCALWALAGCRRVPPVATLVEAQGRVEAATPAPWQAALPPAAFAVDDAVRTGAKSSARLQLGDGTALRLGADTLVRFRPPGTSNTTTPVPAVALDLGTLAIETGAPLLVTASSGRLDIAPHAHVQILAAEGTVRFEVAVGSAKFMSTKGELPLSAGAGVTLAVPTAPDSPPQVVPFSPQAADAAAPDARSADSANAQPPDASVPAAAPESRPVASLAPADLVLAAGDAATVHTGATPLVIRLTAETPCPTPLETSVRTNGRRSRARAIDQSPAHVTLSLPLGTHAYRLSCPGDSRANRSGTLLLKRDAAPVIAKRAPQNLLEADGRKYTVIYGGRRPTLLFTWPDAPDAAAFTLHLDSTAGSPGQHEAPRARVLLPAASVAEGQYSWWFSSAAGVESPRSTLRVRFETAAQLLTPRNGQRADGPTILVSGYAPPSARLLAAGSEVSLDRDGRFSTKVPTPQSSRLVVKLIPKTGAVQYFVRKLGP